MNKKTIFEYIIVFCWFVLIPLIFFLNGEYVPFSGMNAPSYVYFKLLSRIFSVSIIIFSLILIFLFSHSLIKLNYYKKNEEKKLFYKNKLIQYFVFISILVCGLLLNNLYAKIIGIGFGGDHALISFPNNY